MTIIDWLDNNNLKMNVSLTKLIQFLQRLPTLRNLDISHKNIKVYEVTTPKFVGLTIVNKLNWKTHKEAL